MSQSIKVIFANQGSVPSRCSLVYFTYKAADSKLDKFS
jgi:hypothetical protein